MNDQERINSMLKEIEHDFISYDNLHNDGGHGLEIIGEALRDRLKKLEKDNADIADIADIAVLELSVRSYNCLKRAGINSVHELRECIDSGKLMRIRNLGKRSYDEITQKLEGLMNERKDT